MPFKIVFAPLPVAPAVLPKVIADNCIGLDIALHKDHVEQDKEEANGEEEEEENNKSTQASALSPQMARVIQWNVPCLYQQKAHRLLKQTRSSQISLLEM